MCRSRAKGQHVVPEGYGTRHDGRKNRKFKNFFKKRKKVLDKVIRIWYTCRALAKRGVQRTLKTEQ